jgi:hypothetical protein
VQRGGERIYPSNSQMAKVELRWCLRLEALRTYILYEVSSQLAEMLRKTTNIPKKGG